MTTASQETQPQILKESPALLSSLCLGGSWAQTGRVGERGWGQEGNQPGFGSHQLFLSSPSSPGSSRPFFSLWTRNKGGLKCKLLVGSHCSFCHWQFSLLSPLDFPGPSQFTAPSSVYVNMPIRIRRQPLKHKRKPSAFPASHASDLWPPGVVHLWVVLLLFLQPSPAVGGWRRWRTIQSGLRFGAGMDSNSPVLITSASCMSSLKPPNWFPFCKMQILIQGADRQAGLICQVSWSGHLR